VIYSVKPLVLADLKAKFDMLIEREKEQRACLNEMRRELARISRERKVAYRTWQAESKRLVG